MKLNRLMLAAPILLICSCAAVSNNQHVSPSGKYAITFHEAKGESDSYYQIVNNAFPDMVYSSIGGATALNDNDIIWSPTEKTFAILENRPGSIALQNGSGLVRIMYIVSLKEDRDYHMIYMRPFERQYFKKEKIAVLAVSDERVTFQTVNKQATKGFSIESLIGESYRQDAKDFKDDEILD